MQTQKEKFASQADPKLLSAIKEIAAVEGRQMQAVIEEAFRDLVEKKKNGNPRAKVMSAFHESIAKNELLYKKLAE